MSVSEDNEEKNSLLDDITISAGGTEIAPKGDKVKVHDERFQLEDVLENSRRSPLQAGLNGEISSNASTSQRNVRLRMGDHKQPKGKERSAVYSSITELTDELEGAIDSLFLRVDHNSVTVKEFHKQLEHELGHPMPKNLKALVKQRLLRLLRGEIRSSVVNDDEATVSDDKSISSEENNDDEEVKQKLKRRNKKKKIQVKNKGSSKKKVITYKQSPHEGETSRKNYMEQRLKTVRQKKAEDEKVRKEELSGAAEIKIHDEDLRRQEAIAARFETGQEEAKLLREKHRRCLLNQLLMKKRTILAMGEDDVRPESFINDKNDIVSVKHCVKENTPSQVLDAASTTSSGSSESDDSSDGELELIPPSRSSFVDKMLNPSSYKGTSNLNVVSCLPIPKKSCAVSREGLRKSLKCRAVHAGNTWLARELGYKSQEEHLKDCTIAESRRKDILRKQEVKKQILISGSLLKEENNLTEFTPDDDEEQDSEEDEDMQLAHEVMREKSKETCSPVIDEDENETEDVTKLNGSQLVYDNVLGDDSQPNHHQIWDESQLIDDDPVNDGSNQENDPHLLAETQVEAIIEPFKDNSSQHVSSKDVIDDNINSLVSISPNQSSGGTDSQLNPSDQDEKEAIVDVGDTHIDSRLSQPSRKDRKDRAEGWKAMLQREAKTIKQRKSMYKASVSALIEEEAEEEEEDVVGGGLEDFGFGVRSKKAVDEDEEVASEEGDLDGIVDELSDDEGDEEEGAKARKELQEREEKRQHKDILRRMRDGYDGRRGGIASGGARGVHRFEELVAADDRNEARRLGLLNDDELESDEEFSVDNSGHEEDEDEAVLIDKMLKDRFLHRTDEERLFCDDDSEEENEDVVENEGQSISEENVDVMEKLMEKRFEKNARRNRVFDIYGDSLLGSESRIIDEDESLKHDLRCIQTSSKKRRKEKTDEATSKLFTGAQGKLSIALMANIQRKKRATFRSGKSPDATRSAAIVSKPVTHSHVVFQAIDSQLGVQLDNSWSQSCFTGASSKLTSKGTSLSSESQKCASSLWSRVSSNGFRKH